MPVFPRIDNCVLSKGIQHPADIKPLLSRWFGTSEELVLIDYRNDAALVEDPLDWHQVVPQQLLHVRRLALGA